MADLDNIHKTCCDIAYKAGAFLREGFRKNVQITHKSNQNDWVTQYDQQCEALLVTALTKAFPTFGIVGEEGSNIRPDSPWQWHIDPLDGTTNFAHGLTPFSVSLGLYYKNEPQVGVVYDPMADELFSAVKGQGAYLKVADAAPVPLQCSTIERIGSSLMITGFPYDRANADTNNYKQATSMLEHCQGLRRIGSAALDLCYIAAGRAEGYWEQFLFSWDAAAGVLIAQEAGATVSHLDGAPFTLQRQVTLMAATPTIYPKMLAVLQAA